MDALKDYFKKKKNEKKFKNLGPGHRLTEERQVKVEPTAPKAVPREAKPSAATSSAAEAALKRLQGKKETNKPLGIVLEEERRRIKEEMRAKEAAQEAAEKMAQRPHSARRKYVCPSLGICDGCVIDEMRQLIEEGIRSAYNADKLLMGALLIKNCNEDQTIHLCVSTLELILGNLQTEDEEKLEKFKKVKKVKIEQKILNANGGLEFLNGVGFVLDENGEWFVFECNENIKDRVEYCADVLRNSEKFVLEIDREMVLRDPSEFPADTEIGDDFFELTVDDVRREQSELSKRRQTEETLMTKAMRQKLLNDVPEFCRLRIKISEAKVVDVTFRVQETIRDLVEWLLRNFPSDLNDFNIIYNQKAIPEEFYAKTFQELNLYPKVALFLKAKRS